MLVEKKLQLPAVDWYTRQPYTREAQVFIPADGTHDTGALFEELFSLLVQIQAGVPYLAPDAQIYTGEVFPEGEGLA